MPFGANSEVTGLSPSGRPSARSSQRTSTDSAFYRHAVVGVAPPEVLFQGPTLVEADEIGYSALPPIRITILLRHYVQNQQ